MDINNSEYLSKFTGKEVDSGIERIQNMIDDLNLKVDKTTTVNGKALNSNITLDAEDVGALSEDTQYGASLDFSEGTLSLLDQDNVELSSEDMSDYFASAAQGALAETALQPEDVTSVYNEEGTQPVNGIAVKSAVDNAISSIYRPKGSVTFANLPELSVSVLGNVYNVTDSFTIDNRFTEYDPSKTKTYPAGTNVVVINTGTSEIPVYKFDVLAGFVDLSGYQTLITGAASTIASNDLTSSKALISNASGKVAVSDVTSTQLGYLSNTTSDVQNQIDGKSQVILDNRTSGESVESQIDLKIIELTKEQYDGLEVKDPTQLYLITDDTGLESQDVEDALGFLPANSTTAVTHTASTAVGSATQPVYIGSTGAVAETTYSLGSSVPADAVFTDEAVAQNVSDSNADYPVLLASTADATEDISASNALFATGVKVNPSSGSITATSFLGNATSATTATTASKLGSQDVGSATQPIYLAEGEATSCTYILGSSVPSDAVFTDEAMTQNVSDSNATYPILLVSTADADENLGATDSIFATGVKVNPSENSITATSFIGNAISATTASTLGNSNIGSATQPIYLALGEPVATTYSLGKSVPADAIFTDTKNTAGSTDISSKIYLIGSTAQVASSQTYSQDSVFVDTTGQLNSANPIASENSTVVATTKWVNDKGYKTSSGVTSVATGTANGSIAVSVDGGTATDVSVQGLGTAAYTASTAYATSAQGALADTALQQSDVVSTYSDEGTAPINGTGVAEALSPIEALIPEEATSSNQLADKAFVNSSISSNTAVFRGTFNSVEELEAYSGPKTNNDYAFVITEDSDGNTVYARYKYNGTEWVFEYNLNNSSFTAAQWETINSGCTAETATLASSALQQTDVVSTYSSVGTSPINGTGVASAISGLQSASTAVTHTASTAVGSETQPVYIASDGTATSTTYTLGKSVPSDAVFTDTTYSAFTGATGSVAGTSGLVPAPVATDNEKYLKGDGTWGTPAGATYSDFIGADGSVAGVHGLVPAPSATDNTKFLKGDGTWGTPVDTTYADFTGATGSVAGVHGLVPAPSATDNTKFLKGDGTWATVEAGSASLSGLTDVTITSVTDGQVLAYDSASSKWINSTGGGGLTYAMVVEDFTE